LSKKQKDRGGQEGAKKVGVAELVKKTKKSKTGEEKTAVSGSR